MGVVDLMDVVDERGAPPMRERGAVRKYRKVAYLNDVGLMRQAVADDDGISRFKGRETPSPGRDETWDNVMGPSGGTWKNTRQMDDQSLVSAMSVISD